MSTPVQVERDGAVTASRVAREAEQKIQDNPLLPVEIKQSMLRHLQQQKMGEGIKELEMQGPVELDPDKFKRLDVTKFSYQPMDYFAQKFYDRKEEIVVAEMQILKR